MPNILQAFMYVAASGFFGGLVHGLMAPKQYKFRLGDRTWELGSIGEGLVGIAAAIAIFAFADAVFSTSHTDSLTGFQMVKLVAWGVITGYAGTDLLDPLSRRVVQQMVGDAVDTKVAKIDEARQTIREAEQLVAQSAMKLTGMSPGATPNPDVVKLLLDAQRKYEQVLGSDSANISAQIGLANLYSYRAEYLQLINDPGFSDTVKKAISAIDEAIKRDGNVAKAWYNRACYKAQGGDPPYSKDDAAQDLLKAIDLDPSFKEYAKGDRDLVPLRGNSKVPFLV